MKIAPRFKMAFFPFIVILIGLVVSCSMLNWLIFIRSKTFVNYPNLLYLIVPAILSTLSVFYWLRPRFCRLNYMLLYDGGVKLFQIAAVGLLTLVIYFTQILLEDRLTQVVKLDDIADIYNQKASKFFSTREYTVKKNDYGYYMSSFEVPYKHRLYCTIDLFFAFPIFSPKQSVPFVWVGVTYHKEFESNYGGGKEEIERYKAQFIATSFKKINKMRVGQFHYLELMRDNATIYGFDRAVQNSPIKKMDNWVVLLGGYKPLKDRLSEDLTSFFVVLIVALLIWFTLVALVAQDD